MSYGVPHHLFQVFCSKINVKLLMLALGISILATNLGFASCDCNEPVRYLGGTKCVLTPFYYVAVIEGEYDWYRSGATPSSGSQSGSCTEYWGCVGSNNCDPMGCIDSVYSADTNPDDIYVGLGGLGADCFYSGFFPWFVDEHDVSGSWNDNVYSGEETTYGEYYENGNLVAKDEYSAEIEVTAEFNRNSVDKACLVDTPVTISDYQKTLFVRPKDGLCCSCSSGETIYITCYDASHMKANITVGGNKELVIMDDSKWEKGCYTKEDGTGAHSSGGFVTIVPNHGKVDAVDGQPKSATVTYTAEFFDHAGNQIGQGSATVTLTTECKEEAK